jgi:hypothetical protein
MKLKTSQRNQKMASIAATLILCAFVFAIPSYAAERAEILRYEVTWNGNKAGHGDITTKTDTKHVNVTVQAVSDGVLKSLCEIWSQIQATFTADGFKPKSYNFAVKSNLVGSETVGLIFDHKTNMVQVRKQKGRENECHSETVRGVYDPVTAVCLLRSQKDLSKPMFVDIYDGKDRSRLYVDPVGPERIQVKAGTHSAVRLDLKLVKLGNEKQEIGTGKLWISNDSKRIPLLLTSSPILGTIRFELVNAQL